MRVLIYSHDTYGLGHLRRSLVVAKALSTSTLGATVLIATGSPRAQSFDLPAGCDTVKLPAIIKRSDGTYASRDLDVSLEKVVAMRSNLLCSVFRDFAPDMILVDHAPLGVANELVPLFAEIRQANPRPVTILGMRDIVDDAVKTRDSWLASGAMAAVKNDYDRVFVYGSPWVPTTAQELGFETLRDRLGRQKTRHLGFLSRDCQRGHESGRVLVTAGGGGDGQTLLRAFVDFLGRSSGLSLAFDIVTGPFLSQRRVDELREKIATLPHDVQLIRFDPNLEDRIASAKAVIGMAGYNTVTEIMAAERRALLIPRETPRVEQLLRTQRLSGACGFAWCRASKLTDTTFREFLASCERPCGPRPDGIILNGTERFVEEILSLVASTRSPLPLYPKPEAIGKKGSA